MDFYELGIKHNTDKVSQHGYYRFFPSHIDFIKKIDICGIFEIGIQNGNSVKFWRDYFPKAFIYGLDIKKIDTSDEKVIIFTGDQSNKRHLDSVISQVKHQIYLINDDGSHLPEHQIFSFNILFNNLLEKGGVYIIEDIEVSYWKRGSLYSYATNYGITNPNNIINKFKPVLDYINREFLRCSELVNIISVLEKSGFSIQALDNIKSISFCHNCIIIEKITDEDKKYTDRRYKFFHNV